MSSRVALYYVPCVDDPLLPAGNAWLGRDPETGRGLQQPVLPQIQELTAEPGHYGFHATLRAPMRLTVDLPNFLERCKSVAGATPPCILPEMRIAVLDGFLALVLAAPCPALAELAEICVRGTEPLRAPLTPSELARRQRQPLTARQSALLHDWGYPYVFDEWRFHMTLSRRLRPDEVPPISAAAEQHFGPMLRRARRCAEIAVFVESAGGPMRNACRMPLTGPVANTGLSL